MSNNTEDYNDIFLSSSASNDTTAVSSASTSVHQSSTPKDEAATRTSRLDIPNASFRRPSRSSLDSTYTDLSELSFASADYQDHRPLMKSISNDSDYTDVSNYDFPARPTSRTARLTANLRNLYITNYGALLVLLAQFFGSLMNLATRLLETSGNHGPGMHPFQILFVRQSITSLTCTIWALSSGKIPHFPFGPPSTKIRLLLITRGLTGFMGVFGMYFSLLYLPLSEATVMTFLSPILTCYLCSYVLPEQGGFGRSQQVAGLVSLVGVIFIAQPISFLSSPDSANTDGTLQIPSNSTLLETTPPESGITHPTPKQHMTAILVSLIGVIGATGAMTTLRAIGNATHPFLSINYFSVFCTVMSLACLLVFKDVKFRLPGNWTEWGLLATLGGCGFIMQWLLTKGLAYGSGGGEEEEDDTEDEEDIELALIPPTPTSTQSQTQKHQSTVQLYQDNPSSDPQAQPQSPSHIHLHPEPHPNHHSPSHHKAHPSNPHPRKPRHPKISGSGTRATSMVYTQMLFALAGDKLVFGITPGTMSWIGSGLILAGAVWVAAARDGGGKGGKGTDDEVGGIRRTRRVRRVGGRSAGGNRDDDAARDATGDPTTSPHPPDPVNPHESTSMLDGVDTGMSGAIDDGSNTPTAVTTTRVLKANPVGNFGVVG